MTVNTTDITSGPYSGNDVTTNFTYDFRIENKNQLRVFETDDAGVETELTVDTNYTVTGIGNDAGGTITRVAGALPTGYTWYIRSNYLETQDTAFESQGGFFPDVHEKAFDKLTFLSQQQQDQINRAFKLSDSFSGTASAELPNPEALKFVRWNAAASALENTSGTTSDAGDVTYTNPNGGTLTNVEAKLSEIVSVSDFGAQGSPADDTAAFTAAAAASKYVIVPENAAGYNVANTVVANDTVFMFLGRFIDTQLVGSADRYDLNAISIHNGQISAERMRLEPEFDTLIGPNEGGQRALFIRSQQPDTTLSFFDDTCDTTDTDATVTMDDTSALIIGMTVSGDGIPASTTVASITDSTTFELSQAATATATDVRLCFNCGDGPWFFNEIDCAWDGARTGTGIDGGTTSATVAAWSVSLNAGGPNYDLQSAKAIAGGVVHDTADTSSGDKVAVSAGVVSSASSNGKIYGASFSHTLDTGASTPQAVGVEVDSFINDSNLVTDALGFNALSAGTAVPTANHAAYAMSRSGAAGALPWQVGFLLFSQSGNLPQGISTSGDLFAADDPVQMANVFKYDNVTVTGDILKFPNLRLTGAGDYIPADGQGVNFTNTSNSVASGVTTTIETLTDYEEGTWTPVLEDGTNSASGYDIQVGKFTKVGVYVTALCHIKVNNLGSVSGNVRISGLPYNPSGNLQAPGTVGIVGGMSLPVAGQNPAAYLQNGTDYLNLRLFDSTVGQSALTATEFTATGEISITVMYPIS